MGAGAPAHLVGGPCWLRAPGEGQQVHQIHPGSDPPLATGQQTRIPFLLNALQLAAPHQGGGRATPKGTAGSAGSGLSKPGGFLGPSRPSQWVRGKDRPIKGQPRLLSRGCGFDASRDRGTKGWRPTRVPALDSGTEHRALRGAGPAAVETPGGIIQGHVWPGLQNTPRAATRGLRMVSELSTPTGAPTPPRFLPQEMRTRPGTAGRGGSVPVRPGGGGNAGRVEHVHVVQGGVRGGGRRRVQDLRGAKQGHTGPGAGGPHRPPPTGCPPPRAPPGLGMGRGSCGPRVGTRRGRAGGKPGPLISGDPRPGSSAARSGPRLSPLCTVPPAGKGPCRPGRVPTPLRPVSASRGSSGTFLSIPLFGLLLPHLLPRGAKSNLYNSFLTPNTQGTRIPAGPLTRHRHHHTEGGTTALLPALPALSANQERAPHPQGTILPPDCDNKYTTLPRECALQSQAAHDRPHKRDRGTWGPDTRGVCTFPSNHRCLRPPPLL